MTEMPTRLTGRDEDGSANMGADMGAGMGVGDSSSEGRVIAVNTVIHPAAPRAGSAS